MFYKRYGKGAKPTDRSLALNTALSMPQVASTYGYLGDK